MPIRPNAIDRYESAMLLALPAKPMAGSGGGERVSQMVRELGKPTRGVGGAGSGNDGGPPPSRLGAISVVQRALIARGGASPIASHPGVQGTASNPPKGRTVDVRA